MELATTGPQSQASVSVARAFRLVTTAARSVLQWVPSTVSGCLRPCFRYSSNRMIQQTKSEETKIDLGDGLSLWLSSTQQLAAARYVVNEIFTKRRYDHPGFQIRPTDNVVDIGANMGIFTLWAARQANRGKVLAIEPTSAIDALRVNIERNGLTNVVPVQAAAGRDGESFEIVTYPAGLFNALY
jgi:2-polyprenyl-3-methyl-5-hydroxy-6-metoxy-1,4-benzoquinol methylase